MPKAKGVTPPLSNEKPKRPRGGLREAQRRFTRQHILDAAIDVFLERGYIPSTVEDIIERAGTSRPTFYAHFRSKSDVLVELGASQAPEIQDHYRELDEALHAGSWEALRDWFAARLEWSARYGALTSIWEQAAAVEPEREEQRKELLRSFPNCMPRYLARWPEDRRDEAELRILLMSLQLARFFVYSPPRELVDADRAFIADVLTNVWYDGLAPRPGAASK
jgi:AcrR family transcriptional regulator